jgi:proteasome lid subunit RPN8/RPN11
LSTPVPLRLPRPIYEAMLAQAKSELPNECVGLLAGCPGSPVVSHYPLRNALASPMEYESEARSMFDAVRDMRQKGIEIVAIYHSHPTSAPIPSRTDLQRNYSPDVVNLIISLQGPEPVMRGWWLTKTGYREAAWEID